MLRPVISRIRVPVGFALAIFYFYYCQPRPKSLSWGAGIALLGVVLRAWSAGHLYKNQKIATSGPYAYTRNPLYLGSLIIGLGFCVIAGSLIISIVFVTLFAALYIPVMQQERNDLRTAFGQDYLRYEKNVPLFFPRPLGSSLSTNEFRFHQYLANKEYEALLGYLGALAILILKMRLS